MSPDPQLIEHVAQAMDNAFPGLFRSQEECQDIARAAILATLADPAIAAGLALATESIREVTANRVLPLLEDMTNEFGLTEKNDEPTPLGRRLLEICK